MRYYEIRIAEPTTGQPVTRKDGTPFTYTSLYADGRTNSGALQIEMDIPVYSYDAPKGAGGLKIWGVGIGDVSQSADLNGKNIAVYGGMAKGLPLATPSQAGLLVKGQIFQAFGNRVGVDQTLDLIFYAATGTAEEPKNIVFNWLAGTSLSAAIASTLKTAFPTYKQTINVNPKLVLSHDEVGYHQTLTQFASYLNDVSRNILGGAYGGIKVCISDTTLNVFDGSTKAAPKTIAYTDMIGQPTWQNAATLQVQLVMRHDITVGDYITLPKTLATTTPQANSQAHQTLTFQGTCQVIDVRHVGNFRTPDAAAWLTVVTAITQ